MLTCGLTAPTAKTRHAIFKKTHLRMSWNIRMTHEYTHTRILTLENMRLVMRMVAEKSVKITRFQRPILALKG